MKLDRAEQLATRIVAELIDLCLRITIAGSIRRGRAEVNDIDLVLIPKNGLKPIVDRVTTKWRQVAGIKGDARNLRFLSPHDFQLDLFIAHDHVVDLVSATPTNWGAVLLCRTGSVRHNVQLCAHAHSKGLKFAPYRGICRASAAADAGPKDDIIASATEEEIYEAIGLEWRAPIERETLHSSPRCEALRA